MTIGQIRLELVWANSCSKYFWKKKKNPQPIYSLVERYNTMSNPFILYKSYSPINQYKFPLMDHIKLKNKAKHVIQKSEVIKSNLISKISLYIITKNLRTYNWVRKYKSMPNPFILYEFAPI